jgi:hypothetical protein
VRAPVFADAFYWIALTNPADAAHRDAQAFDRSMAGMTVFTTDEVLIESLTFFGSDPWLRLRAAMSAQGLLRKKNVLVIAQTPQFFFGRS